MHYSHIVFDLDGTLLDTTYATLHALQDTLFYFLGERIPINQLTFSIGIPSEDTLKRFPLADIPAAAAQWNQFLLRYQESIDLFPGIEALLEQLSRSGYPLGIVTSKTRQEYLQDFGHFTVSRLFSTVICADDTAEHKPNAAPLLACLEQYNVSARQTIYLGDSCYDSRCAANAGVDFALAGWGCQDRTLPAHYLLTHPRDLLSIL